MGFKVIPLHPGSKVPATKNGIHDATGDIDRLKVLAEFIPDANISVACGANIGNNGLIVVDVDAHHGGIESMKRLVKAHGELPNCPMSKTPQGGFHLYFANDDRVTNSVGTLAKGLDVRSKGGYVVLPPSHWDGTKMKRVDGKPQLVKVCDGGDYRWVRPPLGPNMPPMPQWMLKLLLPKPIPKLAPRKWDKSNASLAQVARALKHVPNYDYGSWTRVGMGLKASFGDEALPIWTNWSCAGYSDFDERECLRKWQSFKRFGGITVGTVFHEARAAGADLMEILRST
jgi:hypothetical protein